MNETRVFIPFKDFKKIGGPTTFMSNLQRYLIESDYQFSSNYKKAGGIFFPISFNLKKVEQIKQAGGFVIQRLDGIYYPSKHGSDYLALNRDIKDIYNNYADFVVFQSEYSKRQCLEMLGPKDAQHCTTIINGVDKSLFYPADLEPDQKKFRFITTGNFRNPDMLEPVINALDLLQGAYDFELVLIGPVVNKELLHLCRRPYIKSMGKMKLTKIAEELRKSHAFIYSHLNPPCPNSVLEALSSGLPVVGFDSGSLGELLFFSRELLAPVSDETFQKYEDFDYPKLADTIKLTIENYQDFKKRALEHAHLFSFQECGRHYVEVFEKVRRQFFG